MQSITFRFSIVAFFFIQVLIGFSSSEQAWSQFEFFESDLPATTSNLNAQEKEKLIRQKIKLRSYPGGYEEEPLRVQPQLNNISRKMAPVQDLVDEPPMAGEVAHD